MCAASKNYRVNISRNQGQWEAFALFRGSSGDWRELVKTISLEKKGLMDAFFDLSVQKGNGAPYNIQSFIAITRSNLGYLYNWNTKSTNA